MPQPQPYLPWPGGTAVGEGCLKGPGKTRRQASEHFSGAVAELTKPLLTQATGWGPKHKGSRLNLKNVPDEGLRPLDSDVEAEAG